MNKMKFSMRLLCVLLSVLMLSCMLPAFSAFASTGGSVDLSDDTALVAELKKTYGSAEERYQTMKECFNNGSYALRIDETLLIVAYKNLATGEILLPTLGI